MDSNLDLFCNFYPRHLPNNKNHSQGYLTILITAILPLFFLAFLDHKTNNQFNTPQTDLTILFRFFISLPLFFLTLKVTGSELKKIIHHFIEASIIRQQDFSEFNQIIQTIIAHRDSMRVKVLILIFIYIFQSIITLETMAHYSQTWRMTFSESGPKLSYAGYWFFLITQPIFYYFMLNIIYRVFLWWSFIYKIRKLNLQLNASHGDGSGGLAFLGLSLKAFLVPALAVSSSMAAGAINVVLLQVVQPNELKFIILLLATISLIYFAGPLLLVAPNLLKLKTQAIFQYGTLARNQLKAFENKWIRTRKKKPDDYLTCSDFSSAIDLNSVVIQVKTMKIIPFQNKEILILLLMILLPFLPIAGLGIDWKEALKQIVKLIL